MLRLHLKFQIVSLQINYLPHIYNMLLNNHYSMIKEDKMKKICIVIAIILSAISVTNSKVAIIDSSVNQTLISENVKLLKYNDNTAYNINDEVLVEISADFPFYITGPHYFIEVNKDKFVQKFDLITFRANLFTKVGVPNETLELREYILLKKDNIFNFDSLVGYQKIGEIGQYSIFVINKNLDDSINEINYSLDEIKQILDNAIQFYTIEETK